MQHTSMLMTATITIALMTGSSFAHADSDRQLIEQGRYLIATAGCNDCHTQGYGAAEGRIPEDEWLTGSAVGFQGPWGTTYPSNLRLMMSNLSEQQWLTKARSPMRPPMPWFNLARMTDGDLKAIYAYVRELGAKGPVAPAYTPPGEKVATPYFEFVPKNLPRLQAGR